MELVARMGSERRCPLPVVPTVLEYDERPGGNATCGTQFLDNTVANTGNRPEGALPDIVSFINSLHNGPGSIDPWDRLGPVEFPRAFKPTTPTVPSIWNIGPNFVAPHKVVLVLTRRLNPAQVANIAAAMDAMNAVIDDLEMTVVFMTQSAIDRRDEVLAQFQTAFRAIPLPNPDTHVDPDSDPSNPVALHRVIRVMPPADAGPFAKCPEPFWNDTQERACFNDFYLDGAPDATMDAGLSNRAFEELGEAILKDRLGAAMKRVL